jgi:hypothetical protein
MARTLLACTVYDRQFAAVAARHIEATRPSSSDTSTIKLRVLDRNRWRSAGDTKCLRPLYVPFALS